MQVKIEHTTSVLKNVPAEVIVKFVSLGSFSDVRNFRHTCSFFYTDTHPLLHVQMNHRQIKVKKIAAGARHSLVLTEAGLYAMGDNQFGQIGLGNPVPRDLCSTLAELHFLRENEQEKGKNYNSLAHYSRLQKITEFDDKEVLDLIVNGRQSNFVITTDGVYAWGLNFSGMLGLGHNKLCTKPTKVIALQHEHVLNIAFGTAFSVFHTQQGLYLFGAFNSPTNYKPKQLIGFAKPIVNIAAGDFHFLALTEDGQLYAMGNNNIGQLGLGSSQNWYHEPQLILTNQFRKVLAISCGAQHSLALTDTGIYLWGYNTYTCLKQHITYAPVRITSLSADTVSKLFISEEHNIAVTTKGYLGWGNNENYQLGTPNKNIVTKPRLLNINTHKQVKTKFSTFALGGAHSLAITDSCNLVVFGNNEYGQLGLPVEKYSIRPTQLKPKNFCHTFKHLWFRTDRGLIGELYCGLQDKFTCYLDIHSMAQLKQTARFFNNIFTMLSWDKMLTSNKTVVLSKNLPLFRPMFELPNPKHSSSTHTKSYSYTAPQSFFHHPRVNKGEISIAIHKFVLQKL